VLQLKVSEKSEVIPSSDQELSHSQKRTGGWIEIHPNTMINNKLNIMHLATAPAGIQA